MFGDALLKRQRDDLARGGSIGCQQTVRRNAIYDPVKAKTRQKQSLGRKEIYDRIFKGEEVQQDVMFSNPGFRGLKVLPYPKHVKKMIENLTKEERKKARQISNIK